ncbi:hypothetical protein CIB84_017390, partial [Bambusicola thoracicus]
MKPSLSERNNMPNGEGGKVVLVTRLFAGLGTEGWLAQGRQQQQNVEDAMKEMQKPLARYIDDEDVDRMLREQEREGDPMAEYIKKRKAKGNQEKKEKPRYSGPAPPPNRFNIWPGHRWDGVD